MAPSTVADDPRMLQVYFINQFQCQLLVVAEKGTRDLQQRERRDITLVRILFIVRNAKLKIVF